MGRTFRTDEGCQGQEGARAARESSGAMSQHRSQSRRGRVASRAPGGFAVLHAYRGAALVTAAGVARQASPPRQDLRPAYDRPEMPAVRRGADVAAGKALGGCDGRSALDTEARSVRTMTTNLQRRPGPYSPAHSKRR